MSHISLDACKTYLGTTQLGVGVRGGAEILIHVAHQVFNYILKKAPRNPNYGEELETDCAVSLDAVNAFNSMRHNNILKGLAEGCPQLVPIFLWTYKDPSKLCRSVRDQVTNCCTGIKQGDNLGPVFFCFGLAWILKEVQLQFPDVTILAFMDDIFTFGSWLRVKPAITRLIELLGQESVNLKINLSKSTRFSLLDPDPDLNIKDSNQGMMVLGAPIGTDEYKTQAIRSQINDKKSILPSLSELNAPEHFALLKSCVNTRPTFMIRTCQPPIMSAAIPDFDNAIMSDLNNLTSVHADQNNRIVTPLPEHAKCIATLPSYLGGIGLSNICSLATAGWTSAWMMSFQFIKSHLPNIYRVATFIDIDADDLIKLKIIPSDAPDPNRAISNLFVGDKCPSQKELAETVHKDRQTQLLEKLANSNDQDRISLLLSASQQGINAWLASGTTMIAAHKLEPDEFVRCASLQVATSCNG